MPRPPHHQRPFRSRLLGVGLALGLWGTVFVQGPLAAQYIPPGNLGSAGEIPAEDGLRTSLEDARWRFGALRVDPWIGLSDGGVVSTVDEERDETDFTVTFGAGLRAYAKSGRRLIWAAHALPEYVWWDQIEEKRSLNGRLGLGLFTYFNRLAVETSLRTDQRQSFFSSEIQELTTVRETTARLGVEVELARRLYVTGSFTADDFDSRESENPLFDQLDRTEERARTGLLYRSPGGFSLGGGFESADVDFDPGARNLSHTAEGTFFNVGFEGERFSASAKVELFDREPLAGSEFAALDTLTGELASRWDWHRSASLLVYGRRRAEAPLRASSSSFINERFGVGVRFGGRRTPAVDFVAEAGSDDFEARRGAVEPRRDDVVAYGVSIAFAVRDFTFRIVTLRTEYDSTLPQFDREITTLNASFELLGFLQKKLRIGEDDRVW